MAIFKIKFEKDECIGCGMCAEECPDNWILKDTKDGRKARPKALTLNSLGCNQRSADACPVGAIGIVKKGKASEEDLDELYDEDF